MKKIERLYFILTYTFFIYPPFIWGLVEIYEPNSSNVHLIVLLFNIILILLIAVVCYVLIITDRLHAPNKEEIKYLVFGFAGNIVMFFYTFQNVMNIDNLVTIYLALLIVMVVHYFLISKTFKPLELWILLPIFLIYDYLFLLLRGCGWESSYFCIENYSYDGLLSFLYWTIIVFITLYYVYKLVLYKLYDIFKILNIGFVIVMSYLFREIYNFDEKLTLTIMILLPFFVIVDFIVKLVNKTYTHKMLLFYVRTTTILIIFMILGTGQFYTSSLRIDFLSIFVTITYISLFISILKTLLNIEVIEENPLNIYKNLRSGPRFKEIDTDRLELIKEQFGVKLANHIKLDDKSYSVAIITDKTVVGFISTYVRQLDYPLESEYEAYINVIEIIPEYRNKGFATKLIRMTEEYFKSKGLKQIRAWSSEDKYEAINLWKKLKYGLSPAFIHIDQTEENVKGFYVVKKL